MKDDDAKNTEMRAVIQKATEQAGSKAGRYMMLAG